MEQRFFVCETCGNIIAMVKPSGVPVMCCGKPMKLIVPNTTDAAQEKHVPVWTREGNLVKVQVGSVAHPMVAAIEKRHEERYRALLHNVETRTVFEKSEVKVWECRNCGHIVVGTQAPEVCPVCNHPQSYFEINKQNY